MQLASTLTVLASACGLSAAGPVPVSRSGLAGIDGFLFYDPYCGHGCFRTFAPYTLDCSTHISAGGHTTATETARQLAICRAKNVPFPSSVAYCMHSFCPEDVLASTRERLWETSHAGDVSVRPLWTYGEILTKITDRDLPLLSQHG
ncbi:ferric-chelate reductase (Fre2) [Fusarium agapanthi]|uniref:Ferric-chelate reductase (Fre2) n=1 Tax=Fusarium agapanthi TaxID=1803897 RepID=A0A9P5BF32_9HYPO|nr:ferric-chelate reductase (Fre2) [Fusarium agapanthi]